MKKKKRLLAPAVAMLMVAVTMISAFAAYSPVCPHCGYEGRSGGIWWGSHDYAQYNSEEHTVWLVCANCGQQDTQSFRANHEGTGSVRYSQLTTGNMGTFHLVTYEQCSLCGARNVISYQTHTTGTTYEDYSNTQHKIITACTKCGYVTSTTYGNHNGSRTYSPYNESTHLVTSSRCSLCGHPASSSYEAHSFGSYGAWSYYNAATHLRSATCSKCGQTNTQTEPHVDNDGDGVCDICGGTLSSVTVTFDANEGECSTAQKDVYYCSVYGELPDAIRNRHNFLGWFTQALEGEQVTSSTVVTNPLPHSLYAHWEKIHTYYQVTWDLNDGTGAVNTTTQEVDELLTFPPEPNRDEYSFLGWFTAPDGGVQVTAETIYDTDGPTTYYAHWEEINVFSVTIPVKLDLVVTPDGVVCTPTTAAIANNSTGPVTVSCVTVQAQNNWSILPYVYDMAGAKVDSKVISFGLNGTYTTQDGLSQSIPLGGSAWTIERNGLLPLSYTAKVSPYSVPLDEQVLTLVFVLEWA